ncbi:MAG: TraB family protein [Thermoplasmata archaeon]
MMQNVQSMKFSDDVILLGVDYIGGEDINEEISKIIKKFEPDTVGLALCEKRLETMDGRDEWSERPLLPHYKAGETGTLIYQAFVDAVRENMRIFKDVEPETHIARLIPLSEKLDVDVEFIDRDVTLTLARAFRGLGVIGKLNLIWYFKSAMLSISSKKKKKSVEGFEEHDDLVEGVIAGISKFAPKVAMKAREERLEYMAKKIHDISKRGRIIAVVPASKLKDIRDKIDDVKKREIIKGEAEGYKHLEKVKKKVHTKALRFISPIFFISLAVYLFFYSDVLNVWRAWLFWYIAVGGMAATGALIARGHPFSILIAFLLAPFMSLTLIGPGWIAGYVELKVRNPKISDVREMGYCNNANEFLSNNIVKVFLVGTFSNVFTWMGLFVVLPLLIAFFGV